MNLLFEITDSPIDSHLLNSFIPNAGGIVIFEGRVRNINDGKLVQSLEYQVYPEMAMKLGRQIIEEAFQKFDILQVKCIHREGHLEIGEMAVYIQVSSQHRENAFKACQYIIDRVKFEVPIWKKEHYLDEPANWVACHGCKKHSTGEHHHHESR